MTIAINNLLSADMLLVMLIAMLVNISCALVGSFLVLRRMSMMGDAISHAILPGLVIGFLFSGTLNILPLFAGAVAAGVATTFLTQTLNQYGRLSPDASLGVVFTSLFALGVVLLKLFVSEFHFDTACVYEGSLLLLIFHTVDIAGVEVPRQFLVAVPVLLLNIAALIVLWKEFKLTTFDSSLASAMGISAPLVHYTLMTLVALTAVASFQVVGSILTIAMLIVPAAAAHLCVERLHRLVALACVFSIVIAIVGTMVAVRYDVSPSGTMAVLAGVLYTLAAVFSPTGGVVARAWFNHQTALRIVREDILAMLYRVEEHDPNQRLAKANAIEAVGGGRNAKLALGQLMRSGDVIEAQGELALADGGRKQASTLVRTHRLWEAYLVDELGLPLDHVHEPAHRVEHFLGEELREQLAERLPEGAEDPHGREIPE